MERAIITIENKEVEIYSANYSTSGYGHKKVTIELRYENEYKEFSSTTSDMPSIDCISEMEGIDKLTSLYSLIESSIEESVSEWLYSI